MTVMRHLKANLYAIEYFWKDDPETTLTGYVACTHPDMGTECLPDAFLDERTDSLVLFWFNNDAEILALKVGDEITDGSYVATIDYEPKTVEERIEGNPLGVLEVKDDSEGQDYIMPDDVSGFWVETKEIVLHIFRPYGRKGEIVVESFPASDESVIGKPLFAATFTQTGGMYEGV